ncbi:MAG: hypothetical protein KAS99_00555 [Candidatus Omnitrophica bacterium]|nr:hypothetical protein [Candidatus Omnitrophota bacterium]
MNTEVMLGLKAIENIDNIHHAQLLNYFKNFGLRVG